MRIYYSARSYSELAFSESLDQPLEQRLNDFFRRFYKAIVRVRIAKREEAERERLYQEQEDRRRKAEAVKQQEVRQRAKENERRELLLSEARTWNEASLIRDYVSHIEKTLTLSREAIEPELKGWLMWTERVADEMDPTQRRIRGSDNH